MLNKLLTVILQILNTVFYDTFSSLLPYAR